MTEALGNGLMQRSGLSHDLRVLVEQYPRKSWNVEHHIGDLGRFWIQRHDGFRKLGKALVDRIDDLREERLGVAEYARWFAPRLNQFLGELDGHHQVEDYQYFPRFAAADARLAKGFELLEEDHQLIHTLLESNIATAQPFYKALLAGETDVAVLRDAHALEAEKLLTGLMRHLEDEEDLIIPLLLDQGEERFW